MLQGQKNVCSIELSCVLLKATNLAQVEEELSTRAVLEAEVKLALSLECVVHLYDELVIDGLQNTTLIKGVLELIAAQNLILLQNFERIHLLCVLFLDEEDLTVAALTNNFQLLEVFHRDCARTSLRPGNHGVHLLSIGSFINGSILILLIVLHGLLGFRRGCRSLFINVHLILM